MHATFPLAATTLVFPDILFRRRHFEPQPLAACRVRKFQQTCVQRDAALRALSSEYFGDGSVNSRAKAIAEISERYQTTCWPRDRLLGEMPERYCGTLKEHLWRAFRPEAKMPVSERHLRTLLSD